MTEHTDRMPPKQGIAYYHLPGLFAFYDLYCAFLPLYRKHREYFYEWCEIGSLYGAPSDCIWGGGRVGAEAATIGSLCVDAGIRNLGPADLQQFPVAQGASLRP